MSKVAINRMREIFAAGLPASHADGVTIDRLGDGNCTLRLPVRADMVRPGGTLSGPSIMGLADAAMWVAVMAAAGEIELAVTTSFNINFLKKPPMADIVADAVVLKLGKRLAVVEVGIFAASDTEREDLLAHATGTYSLPPGRGLGQTP